MRSPALIKPVNALAPGDYATVTLDRPGPHNKPRAHESAAVKLSKYPAIVRQFITNDHDTTTTTTKHLIARYRFASSLRRSSCPEIRANAETCPSASTSRGYRVGHRVVPRVLHLRQAGCQRRRSSATDPRDTPRRGFAPARPGMSERPVQVGLAGEALPHVAGTRPRPRRRVRPSGCRGRRRAGRCP